MIALDTNILVYAHRGDSRPHDLAADTVRSLAENSIPWAIPWPCLHEFYGIVTHPKVYSPPSTPPEALAQVDAWLESPSLVLLTEGPAHWSTLRQMLLTGRIQGPKVHDARIAALCRQHGVRELWTADRDFRTIPGIVARNPLAR